MQKFLDQLNDNLKYISYKENGKELIINCEVEKLDYLIRGYKNRILKDINYGDKFIILSIRLPIYYKDKTKKESFVHPLKCCDFRSRNTKRLEQFIIDNIKESSAIGLERTIKKHVCYLSDSSILRILKKNQIQISTMKNLKK